MLNVQTILNQLNVSPEMQNKVISAYQTASELAAGVQTKEQALSVLKQNGVDRNAMQKISKYLNHPLATMAAGFADININKVRSHFNILMDAMGTCSTQGKPSELQVPASGMASTDPLAKYKNGLRQL